MKIKYEFADGTVSEVEVEESVGAVIVEPRRIEDNLSRKERYHCYSLDAVEYEGMEYADETTPEDVLAEQEYGKELQEALGGLTDIQRQRAKSLADGLSMLNRYNEIYRVQMPKITPHVCRHTYCSNMAKAEMNPKTLQYLMGHSDIGVTLNTYTHLGLEDAEDELKRVKGLEDARKKQDKTKGEKPVSQKMSRAI